MSVEHEAVRIIANLLRAAGDELLKLTTTVVEKPPQSDEKHLFSVAEYARSIGKSRHTVTKWVEAGLPCIPGPRGVLIEVGPARKWLADGGLCGQAGAIPPYKPQRETTDDQEPRVQHLDRRKGTTRPQL